QLSFLPGEHITGETAALWGWANEAVPAAELLDRVTSMAHQMAKVPPAVLTAKKEAVNRAADAQAWRFIMSLGAETDALLHHEPAVRVLQRAIERHGLKEAIRLFQSGDLQPEFDALLLTNERS